MIEELWEMYRCAKKGAIARNESGDFRGYVEALSFAFQFKCFALELELLKSQNSRAETLSER